MTARGVFDKYNKLVTNQAEDVTNQVTYGAYKTVFRYVGEIFL